ncbi:MAG: PilZ domain-containing protein [Candidatus Gastranaerophilales bacterium]|nr:PilZ domain-containing protein [Candidatus Gastranaerophilales bacterium]MCM1072941.1 PilZ domain-containing protein [Bacteroides sp.]
MRELIKKEQLVTIVPQDFKNSNKGKVLDVSLDGFKMELKYKPEGLIKDHICDFYSLTDNGYLYFESYIQEVVNNVVSIANPVKHRFLQRRKFTRIKFLENLELVWEDTVHKVRSLDLSAGGMKLRTEENIDIEKEYKVCIKLSDEQEVKCKYQLIRVEKGDSGLYTISGRFTNLSNIDKMTLIQFCMKKDMENLNK